MCSPAPRCQLHELQAKLAWLLLLLLLLLLPFPLLLLPLILDLNPGLSACEADVLPLHYVPFENCEFHRGPRQARQVMLTLWSQEVSNCERNALITPSHSRIEPKRCMRLLRESSPGQRASVRIHTSQTKG